LLIEGSRLIPQGSLPKTIEPNSAIFKFMQLIPFTFSKEILPTSSLVCIGRKGEEGRKEG